MAALASASGWADSFICWAEIQGRNLLFRGYATAIGRCRGHSSLRGEALYRRATRCSRQLLGTGFLHQRKQQSFLCEK